MPQYLAGWLSKALVSGISALQWIRRHSVTVALLVLLLAALPSPRVHGQLPSPCCAILAAGLGSINDSLINVIGGGLSAINNVLTDIKQFEQTVVWPKEAIAQALGVAGQVQGVYAQIRGIFLIPIATATLPNPRQLETILLSRSASQIPNTTAGYAAVYGVVPTPENAPPPVRDLIDMTDATAQDAMARAIAIDAIADKELAAADQIGTNVQSATAGTAGIIEAQADAWLIRANAYTQSALADTLRVRAIDLANNAATLKLGSAWAVNTQQDINNSLQHK